MAESREPAPDGAASLRLAPASQFSIEALAEAYNRTRVNYLIPMPMDAAGLQAYARVYDIDLDRSRVALAEQEILGLAMLAARPGRTWLTRLGVMPDRRRSGAGAALVCALQAETNRLGCPLAILEVIKENKPARRLFEAAGFQAVRELVVLRRPAGRAPGPPPSGAVRWLGAPAALDLLTGGAPHDLPWTNQPETFLNGADARAVLVDLPAGSGWLVFRRQPGVLSHFVLRTLDGDPLQVAAALLAHLYARYSALPSDVENIPAGDPHLPALHAMGLAEVFRRVEMHWAAAPAG